jgi:hypothetical protein
VEFQALATLLAALFLARVWPPQQATHHTASRPASFVHVLPQGHLSQLAESKVAAEAALEGAQAATKAAAAEAAAAKASSAALQSAVEDGKVVGGHSLANRGFGLGPGQG